MPQLRDSSTTRRNAEQNSTSSNAGPYARIFGIETEYGLSATGTDLHCSAEEIAMAMFHPVVSRSRSTNTYLSNGSRLYLDVGAHPEYATAEARDPLDALAQDLAGERVMKRLALAAQRELRHTFGSGTTIHVYKNNVDSAGHSFGCHENYLVRRNVSLETIERELLPFLITRQIITGAGTVRSGKLVLSQRADFLDEAVSSATTRVRPMVNTRDEPHANADEYRRLHVIIGDSNRSQTATFMKLALTHLVLCVIEYAVRNNTPSGLQYCALKEPAVANRSISEDTSGKTASFALLESCRSEYASPGNQEVRAEHGTHIDVEPGMQERMLAQQLSIPLPNADTQYEEGADTVSLTTALRMQRYYCDVVQRFVDLHEQELQQDMPKTEIAEVMRQWDAALKAVENEDYGTLGAQADWAVKRNLCEAVMARKPGLSGLELERLDLDYHDIANGHVYSSLISHSVLRTLLSESDVEEALNKPPADTRAALRGAFVQRALDSNAQFTCDWTHIALHSPQRHEVVLLDPFNAQPNTEFLNALNGIQQ